MTLIFKSHVTRCFVHASNVDYFICFIHFNFSALLVMVVLLEFARRDAPTSSPLTMNALCCANPINTGSKRYLLTLPQLSPQILIYLNADERELFNYL